MMFYCIAEKKFLVERYKCLIIEKEKLVRSTEGKTKGVVVFDDSVSNQKYLHLNQLSLNSQTFLANVLRMIDWRPGGRPRH